MLLARIRGWKKPKSPFNGSSHLVLEANQEGRGAVGCPDPLKLRGSVAICKAGPILMGLRGGFWWLLGGWGGGPGSPHKPWGQESWGCSGSWDPPWAIKALSPPLPAAALGSASSLRTTSFDGVPGGCPRRRDSDGK